MSTLTRRSLPKGQFRILFETHTQLKDYYAYERESRALLHREFRPYQRMIAYCYVHLQWGREKISARTGISERQVRNFIQQLGYQKTIQGGDPENQ